MARKVLISPNSNFVWGNIRYREIASTATIEFFSKSFFVRNTLAGVVQKELYSKSPYSSQDDVFLSFIMWTYNIGENVLDKLKNSSKVLRYQIFISQYFPFPTAITKVSVFERLGTWL